MAPPFAGFTIILIAALTQNVFAETISCPGILHVDFGDSTSCCVGGTVAPVMLSSCAGWPICTGPVTVTHTPEPTSCAVLIPLTDSNYNQLVSEASVSLTASGTHYQTEIADPGITISGASIGSSVASTTDAASLPSSTGGSTAGTSATTSTAGNGASGLGELTGLYFGAIAGLLGGAIAVLV